MAASGLRVRRSACASVASCRSPWAGALTFHAAASADHPGLQVRHLRRSVPRRAAFCSEPWGSPAAYGA